MRHLAQLNIGRLAYEIDDPRLADFAKGFDVLQRVAERSDGFIWKHETAAGGIPLEGPVYDDPNIVVNLTVWRDVDTLSHFVWKTLHKHFVARRGDWFIPIDQSQFVMWWIKPGHRPTLAEAKERLDHYRVHGASHDAFGWEDMPGRTVPADAAQERALSSGARRDIQ